MAFLSGNMLKVLAALFMLLDHMGLMLFPQYPIFRILGRLAFPIFAFMIAEGCKYTRSRRKYFGMVFGLAALCQVVYYFFDGSMYLSILVTFSLSILMIYALDAFKRSPGALTALIFVTALAAVYGLNRAFTIDYGFWGCLVPVFASALRGTKYDSLPAGIAMLGLGLVGLALDVGGIQMYSLLALPLLLLYNGKRGKWRMKYFFYIFYPAHLVVLEGIWLLLN